MVVCSATVVDIVSGASVVRGSVVPGALVSVVKGSVVKGSVVRESVVVGTNGISSVTVFTERLAMICPDRYLVLRPNMRAESPSPLVHSLDRSPFLMLSRGQRVSLYIQ